MVPQYRCVLYAIRVKAQPNLFLPNPKTRRGGTHVEPVDFRTTPPRLFTKPGHAKNCLRQWVQGPLLCFVHYVDGDDYYTEERIKHDRKAEDMEIVRMLIEPGAAIRQHQLGYNLKEDRKLVAKFKTWLESDTSKGSGDHQK